MDPSILIIGAVVGAAILFFGRRLFWLFVAAIGFAAGVEIAPHLVQQPTPVLALSFALVLGFVGALLALFLQKVAIGIAGFLAGGKLATAIASAFLVQSANYLTITFIVGGIIGALLLVVLFDWALIILSSVVGAYLIGNVIPLPLSGAAILFVLLVIVGILIQAAALRRRTPQTNY